MEMEMFSAESLRKHIARMFPMKCFLDNHISNLNSDWDEVMDKQNVEKEDKSNANSL